MLRTILVALDDSPYTETSTSLAIEWAKRFDAQLWGLGLLDTVSIARPQPVSIGGASYRQGRDAAMIANTQGLVQDVIAKFREQCSAADVKAEVFEDIGDPAANILRVAHRCDVVMLGRQTHFHLEREDPDGTVGIVLRGCPRPITVVPPELPAGEGVMVAYSGGREVAHALQTFHLLGLDRGETVHVVGVDREGWQVGELAHLACEYLKSHGVHVEFHELASKSSPAEVILEQVQKLRPRMMVMGTHGYHPLRELFTTSVTRNVLRSCPVPVFVGG